MRDVSREAILSDKNIRLERYFTLRTITEGALQFAFTLRRANEMLDESVRERRRGAPYDYVLYARPDLLL